MTRPEEYVIIVFGILLGVLLMFLAVESEAKDKPKVICYYDSKVIPGTALERGWVCYKEDK